MRLVEKVVENVENSLWKKQLPPAVFHSLCQLLFMQPLGPSDAAGKPALAATKTAQFFAKALDRGDAA